MRNRQSQILPPEGHSTARATAAGIGAIALWCTSGVCYAAGSRVMGAMPYLSLISAAGVATIVLLQLLRGRSPVELLRIPLRVRVAGFFGVVLYSIMLVGALGLARERDLGAVILLNYLWPIWIVLLGMVLLDTKVRTGLALSAAVLGFAGVAMAQGAKALTHPPSSFLPHALSLVGAFFWALYSVLLRRWRIPEEQGGSTFHFLVCAILAAVIAAVQGDWGKIPGVDSRSALLVIFGGVGPIGLAYYWWEIGMKRGSVHLIAVLAYFIPIVSAGLIALVFRSALSPGLLPGAAMIALGAYLGRRAIQTRPLNE